MCNLGRPHGNYVSTLLNHYEMPTELASEDSQQDSERVEQQEEETFQIINRTKLPFIPCFAILCA